uniref:Uncharacterized protein n=1 Tax=Marseillevirus LCMAC102 TaxID=2506603 RepID=A0A481YUX3_9VIRU|nr:MAG: hypothetical protein LCMAC102_03900 [Marseillevirus LCMAC102]
MIPTIDHQEEDEIIEFDIREKKHPRKTTIDYQKKDEIIEFDIRGENHPRKTTIGQTLDQIIDTMTPVIQQFGSLVNEMNTENSPLSTKIQQFGSVVNAIHASPIVQEFFFPQNPTENSLSSTVHTNQEQTIITPLGEIYMTVISGLSII